VSTGKLGTNLTHMPNDEFYISLDQKLDKVVDKMDSMYKTMQGQALTLTEQSVTLKEHIRRTELAEKNIEAIRRELKPVQKHVAMVHGALKLIGLICLVGGFVVALLELILKSHG
jgi:hypothetical protein